MNGYAAHSGDKLSCCQTALSTAWPTAAGQRHVSVNYPVESAPSFDSAVRGGAAFATFRGGMMANTSDPERTRGWRRLRPFPGTRFGGGCGGTHIRLALRSVARIPSRSTCIASGVTRARAPVHLARRRITIAAPRRGARGACCAAVAVAAASKRTAAAHEQRLMVSARALSESQRFEHLHVINDFEPVGRAAPCKART